MKGIILCVIAAFLLPYVWICLAKYGAKNFKNRYPRQALEKLKGWQQRAYWAHLNSFETLPAFLAAVVIAHLNMVPATTILIWSFSFVVFRILHGIFYIADKEALRSLAFFGGFICVLALFVMAI